MHRFDSFQVREPDLPLVDFALGFRRTACRSSSARFASESRLSGSVPRRKLAILRVGVGKDLLPHDVKEPNQEAARPAGRVANDVAFLRIDHADHEFDDGSRA